jgi:hypothetical protein
MEPILADLFRSQTISSLIVGRVTRNFPNQRNAPNLQREEDVYEEE